MLDNVFSVNGISERPVTAHPKHLNTIKLIVLLGDKSNAGTPIYGQTIHAHNPKGDCRASWVEERRYNRLHKQRSSNRDTKTGETMTFMQKFMELFESYPFPPLSEEDPKSLKWKRKDSKEDKE